MLSGMLRGTPLDEANEIAQKLSAAMSLISDTVAQVKPHACHMLFIPCQLRPAAHTPHRSSTRSHTGDTQIDGSLGLHEESYRDGLPITSLLRIPSFLI